MKWILTIATLLVLLTSCSAPPPRATSQTQPIPTLREVEAPVSTNTPPASLPNPASVFCEQQGNRLEIRTAPDGSQSGVCIFPDGSECDEWAFFRGECGAADSISTSAPASIPTVRPIDPADYGPGWWTYTHSVYGFSIMLPEDWVVEEITTFDPAMSGHTLTLHPNQASSESIRMTFRHAGEDVRLWPTGVGQGEFVEQGTLDIAGQPARRMLLVCPTGEVTAIWYHDAQADQPDIGRGDMEFGFIYGAGSHCETGKSLGGKVQLWGEMIIGSLKVL
jgi:putative hemolysin